MNNRFHTIVLAISFALSATSYVNASTAPTFGPAQTVTTAPHVANMVLGDFNGDGNPDVAVLDDQSGVVEVHFGDGLGGFDDPPATFTITSSNNHFNGMAAADIDGDGNSDLIFAAGNAVRIYEWNGSAFTAKHVTVNGADVTSMSLSASGIDATKVAVGNLTRAASDPNGGSRDIVVSDDFGSVGLVVIANDGTGNFSTPTTKHAGGCDAYAKPILADVHSLDGDGLDDVVLSHGVFDAGSGKFVGRVGVLLNNGNGTLADEALYKNSSYPSLQTSGVAVADVDGDGKPDLVTVASVQDPVQPINRTFYLNVNLNTGNGTFADATDQTAFQFQRNSGLNTISSPVIDAADIDGDGRPDIVTLTQAGGANTFFGFTVTQFSGTGASLAKASQDDFPTNFTSYQSIALGYKKNDGTFVTFNDDPLVDVLVGTTAQFQSPAPPHSQFLVFPNTTGSAPPAPLSIAMSASSESDPNQGLIVRANDLLSYLITVTNNGSDVAKSLEVTDALPLYLSAKDNLHKIIPTVKALRDITDPKSIAGKFDKVTPTTPKDDAGKPIKTIRWAIGDLAPGETKTVGFTIRITSDFRLNSSVANTVYAVKSAVAQPTTGADGSAAPFQSAVVQSYSLTGTSTPATVVPGGIITYTVQFKNLSTQPLTKITVVDAIPSDTFFFDATTDSGDVATSTDPVLDSQGQIIVPGNEFQNTPTQVIWTISTVKAGQTATLTFRVVAKTDLPPAGMAHITNTILTGSYKVTGSTFYFGHFDSGGVPPEVIATGVPITSPPKLLLAKAVVDDPKSDKDSISYGPDGQQHPSALAGSQIGFLLYFFNDSGNAGTIATGCYVKDRIPDGAKFVAGSVRLNVTGQPQVHDKAFLESDGKTLVMPLPDIPPNGSGYVTYKVKLPSPKVIPGGTTIHSVGAVIGAQNINATPESFPDDDAIAIRGKPAFVIESHTGLGVLRGDASLPTPGYQLYNVFYKNTGTGLAQNVVLKDATPAGTTLVGAPVLLSTAADGQPGPGRFPAKDERIVSPQLGTSGDVFYVLGTLKPGESGWVQLEVVETAAALNDPTHDLVNNPQIGADEPVKQLSSFAAQSAAQTRATRDLPQLDFTIHAADFNHKKKIEATIAEAFIHVPMVHGVPQGGTIQWEINCGNVTNVDAAPAVLLIPLPSGTSYTGNTTAIVDVPYTVSTGNGQPSGAVGYVRVDFDKIPAHGVETFIVELAVNPALVSRSIEFDHGPIELAFTNNATTGNGVIVKASPSTYIYPYSGNGDDASLDAAFADARGQIGLAALAHLDRDAPTQALQDPNFTTRLDQMTRKSMHQFVRGAAHFVADNGAVIIPMLDNKVLVAGPDNVISNDGGSIISHDGGTIVASGGGNLIKLDVPAFGTLTAAATLVQAPQIVSAGAGNIHNAEGLALIGHDGASLVDNTKASLITSDGAGLITSDGAGLITSDGAGIKSVTAGIPNIDFEIIGDEGSGVVSNSSSTLVGAAKGGYLMNAGGGGADKNAGKNTGVAGGLISSPTNSAVFTLTTGGHIVSEGGAGILTNNGGTIAP